MIFLKKQIGQHGEDLAVVYLKQQGYRILERNFKTKYGEIDIIAQEGSTLCFVEVKTRSSEDYGTPFESISKPKQYKLSRVALGYLKYKKLFDVEARFDVISVLKEKGTDYKIEIIKDAFDLT